MAVCRHCGAIIDDNLEYCPDCGQKNTEQVDESYLDNLLNALVANEPTRPEKKESSARKKEKKAETPDEDNFFIPTQADMDILLKDFSENPDMEDSYNLFEEEMEEDAYNIFDELEDVDVESMIANELGEESELNLQGEINPEEIIPEDDLETSMMFEAEEQDVDEFFSAMLGGEAAETDEAFVTQESELEDFFALTEDEMETLPAEEEMFAGLFAADIDGEEEKEFIPETEEIIGMDAEEFAGLDDLFQGFDEDDVEEMTLESISEEEYVDSGLEELLVAESQENLTGEQKKQKVGFWKRFFGNVPVDPAKVKPEPTAEELAASKQKKAEEKKKTATEKKLAAAEKKEASKKRKEEKIQKAQLAKEEKKQRKMEAAKQVLEEMGETRINRVGASIVFVFFAIIAIVLIIGSNLFTYSVSIKNAKKNFEQACNNDTRYYTEAYNHIYGLEMRNEDDQKLNDKIMTVMYVNKELNSYNSYMLLEDYESALHSLVKGLYRYGKYIEQAFELDIDKDMDFVRTQILKELYATFHISEDEAERLRNLLYESLSDDERAVDYSKEIYKIVDKAENLQ